MAQEWAKSFYKSKLWKDTREYILKRDKYKCVKCGAMAAEVHHKVWLTRDNINDPNISVNEKNLESLCYQCHKAEHIQKKIIEVDYKFDAEGNIIPPGGE